MNVVLLSPLFSEEDYKYIQKKCNISYPGQKFYSLLYQGIKKNGISIKAFSIIPERYKTFTKSNSITYFYKPNSIIKSKFVNVVSKEIKKYINEDSIIIADGEAYWTLVVALKQKCKVVSLITDFPHNVSSYSSALISKPHIYRWLYQKYAKHKLTTLKKADGYIFLTEYMKDVIGSKKPYLVIEGFTNANYSLTSSNKPDNKKKIISYLGALNDKSGIMNLVKAISLINDQTFCLNIYGKGHYVEELKSCSDKRVTYKGVVSLDEVERIENESDFLINPRPAKDEFNKYSFPSKTLEYMSSGTPVITTKLSGIPKEYFRYLLVLDDSSVDKMADCINEYLNADQEQMRSLGKQARDFVLSKKNNIIQGEKIIKFLEKTV